MRTDRTTGTPPERVREAAPSLGRRAVIALLACLALAPGARAAILFESAALGPTDQGSGFNFTSLLLGVRFELSALTQVTAIGGHMAGSTANANPDDTVFGAIVRLSGPGDFPDSPDLSTPDVLGHALLPLPNTNHSNDFSASLSLTLSPGTYALIFGGVTSGLFGATGNGYMTTVNPIVVPQDFFARNLGGPGYFNFSTNPDRSLRFFVEGTPVAEPSSLALLLAAAALLCGRCASPRAARRRARMS